MSRAPSPQAVGALPQAGVCYRLLTWLCSLSMHLMCLIICFPRMGLAHVMYSVYHCWLPLFECLYLWRE